MAARRLHGLPRRDVEDTDRYGRFLRYVWTEDGAFFNEFAVRHGHAEASLYEPNDRYIDRMRRAERQARNADRGMWGQPCEHPFRVVLSGARRRRWVQRTPLGPFSLT